MFYLSLFSSLNRSLILLRSGVSFHWRVNPLQSAWAIKTNVFKSQRDCQDRLILCKFPGYKMATRGKKIISFYISTVFGKLSLHFWSVFMIDNLCNSLLEYCQVLEDEFPVWVITKKSAGSSSILVKVIHLYVCHAIFVPMYSFGTILSNVMSQQ